MKDTPRPVTEINPALPLEFGRILRRCLAKDPAHRYQTAIDLRNELEELKQDLSGPLAKGGVRQLPPGQRHKWGIAGAISTVMVLAAVGVFVFVARGRVNDRATHFEATFARLTTEPGIEEFPSLSPDGKWVVYQSGEGGKLNINLQSVTGQTPINL